MFSQSKSNKFDVNDDVQSKNVFKQPVKPGKGADFVYKIPIKNLINRFLVIYILFSVQWNA